MGISKGWFADIGAWDGIRCSNTYALLKSGWRGVLVECGPNKFINLKKNVIPLGGIPILQKVSCEPGEDLDVIFKKTPLPKNFDLLSLDIDGNDYWVWQKLSYKPKVVVIEFNPHFAPSELKVMPYNPKHVWQGDDYYGASSGAMLALGIKKGYVLVGTVRVNLFFVDSQFAKLFKPADLPNKFVCHKASGKWG